MKTITMTALLDALRNYHSCVNDENIVCSAEWSDDSKTAIAVITDSEFYQDALFIERIIQVDNNGTVTVETNEGSSVIKFFKQFNPFE